MADKTRNEFYPDYAVHPGEILAETLLARGISNNELAARTGLSVKHISQIINGKAPVSSDTAIMLERILDVTASLWLKLDSDYRLFKQREEEQSELIAAYEWANKFPIKELIRRGVLAVTQTQPELVAELLDFFNVGTVDAWQKQYEGMVVKFRRAASKITELQNEAMVAWLKIGENKAKQILTMPFNKARFESALKQIKSLTSAPPAVFEPALVKLCAKSGVAVVFVKELPGTGVSGATYWLSKEKAILMLSLRYKWDDIFWFTFFHEAGHIILHGNDQLIVDGNELAGDQLEDEANTFAAEFLIPPSKYKSFIMRYGRPDESTIRSFAAELQIAPGIIVGRMQKEGRIPYSWYNKLKKRFSICD